MKFKVVEHPRIKFNRSIYNYHSNPYCYYGLEDSQGNLILPHGYYDIYHRTENGATEVVAKKENHKCFHFVVQDNKLVASSYSEKYDSVFPLYKDIILCRNDGFFGALNPNGEIVIQFKYDSLRYLKHPLFNNLLWAIKDNKNAYSSGIIDYNDNVLVPFEYNIFLPLDNTSLIVGNRDRKWFAMNKKFNIVDRYSVYEPIPQYLFEKYKL